MGNCQALDTATLVIQHPCGKSETMYWSISANEVMEMNPGHYVALLITSDLYPSHSIQNTNFNNNNNNNSSSSNSVRVTRIKLLKSTDSLVLGQVYRLITTQEVMKSLWLKKQAKMKNRLDSSVGVETVTKHEHNGQRTSSTPTNPTIGRSKMWQPSLKSISEATT